MKKVSLMVLAVALVFSLFATPLRAAGEFNDVKGNQWFAPYVYDLADRGILNGKGNGKFEPEGNVTRAEFAKILAYASKDELKQYEGDSPFADCGSHWSKTNINWAYANGIVKGKSETTFAPNAEITREEMATMIYRYADYKDLALPKKADKITFKDADKIGSWAKEAVAAMQQANIIGGYPDGTFLPKNQASRAEAAKMISVFLKEATAKGVTEETYQDFMDKDVKDFEADRVLNFDASLADNFAVVQDDVELVQDNAKINQVTAANEEKGVYVFSNIDHRMKNLKPGDKLMIAGDDYEECVSLVVDNIEFSGAKAIITSQGGEIEDFFDYIQLDMEIPVSQEYLDTSNLPAGVTLESVSSGSAGLADVNFGKEFSQNFKFGMNFQIGGVKAAGSTNLKLTVDATVNWDPELFGKDYLECDMKATVENSNDLSLELTEAAIANNFIEIPLGSLDIPLGATGLFINGDLNFIIDFDGSLKAEIETATTKTTGFTYNTKAGFNKIDEMTTDNLKTVLQAEGKVSGGVEAGLTLSLAKVVEAKVFGESGIEAKATADMAGGERHTCFLCFDGKLYKYSKCKFKVKTGAGKLAVTPVDTEIERWEDKINDFYCSKDTESGSFSFGWGNCPNRDGGGGGEGGGAIVDSGTCGENLTWTLDENGTLNIAGTGAMYDYDWAEAPWYFQFRTIYKVIINNSVTTIGDAAFFGCTLLTSVTIPDSVKTIGNSAFNRCESMTSVTIPNSVTTIGNSAFDYCHSLTSVTIPNSVISIGDAAFYDCKSLTSVTIPDSVTTIGDTAFTHCESLTSVTIPDSVTTIGDAAFSYCHFLASVTISDSVKTIGHNTFSHCYFLTSVTIPDSVIDIGDWAFSDCASLASLTIGNSVKTIGTSAFYGCESLTSVTIPDSVIDMGDWAFVGCYSLTTVKIGNSLTAIGNYTFYVCGSLTSVTIGNSVKTIGENAFGSCGSLVSVTIPKSVTSMENSAFDYCDSLTSITVNESNPNYSSFGGVLLNKSQKKLIKYPGGKQGAYTIPDSVTTIGNSAFSNCNSLTAVAVSDNVTTIENNAFSYCHSLTSVTIGNSVATIGNSAFLGCDSLTSVTIPNGVVTIEGAAFSSCGSLTSVTIGNSVTTIGNAAFFNCHSLASVTIPDSVTTIGDYAFYDCRSLASVTIPNSVTTIGDSAFSKCTLFTSVTIPDSVTTIGDSAFYYCHSLTSVTIPDSVTTIGDSAFSGCKSLTSVTIPDSITTIGNSMFSNCESLTSVTIPDNVTTIGKYAFLRCKSLTSVTVPDSVTTIGYSAFDYCDSLSDVYYKGNEDDKAKIDIERDNGYLINATWHYNS